jgi:hypothetical protein
MKDAAIFKAANFSRETTSGRSSSGGALGERAGAGVA